MSRKSHIQLFLQAADNDPLRFHIHPTASIKSASSCLADRTAIPFQSSQSFDRKFMVTCTRTDNSSRADPALLGKAMLETKGMLWPWIIHFVADVFIFFSSAMLSN